MGSVIVEETQDWMTNAIAKYCDQCKKRTPQEYTVADIQLLQKGRMTSGFWMFLGVITLGISIFFTIWFYRDPLHRYLYNDKCTKCGIETKVESVTYSDFDPRDLQTDTIPAEDGKSFLQRLFSW